MIDLLAGGRSGQLLGDDAAERQEHPLATGSGERRPEVGERDARARLQRARGGTARDGVGRTMILRVEMPPGEAGTNRPASGAPGPRLWGAARRIDKAELRGWPVCGFCNSHKGPNLTGIDPDSGEVVSLFHPRRERWEDHFTLQQALIVGRSPTGRATVHVLAMNAAYRLHVREELIAQGSYP